VYDFLIGGTLNYAMDRAFAEKVMAQLPRVARICQLNRLWLQRVVRFGIEQGIRQFLDIGSGMPTAADLVFVLLRRVVGAPG
jgi:S-adenosyl methyltransferase